MTPCGKNLLLCYFTLYITGVHVVWSYSRVWFVCLCFVSFSQMYINACCCYLIVFQYKHVRHIDKPIQHVCIGMFLLYIYIYIYISTHIQENNISRNILNWTIYTIQDRVFRLGFICIFIAILMLYMSCFIYLFCKLAPIHLSIIFLLSMKAYNIDGVVKKINEKSKFDTFK